MDAGIVRTENLTKSYGRRRGVSRLNLDIRRGEIFGFLGPNGAGKTTTIRLLLDLIRPSSGRALVFGFDCRRESAAIRRRVGYLPGEFALYEHLTGHDLMEYFAGLRGGVDRSFVGDLAKRLGSDLRRRLGELSHGNKQKVGLIQALMNRPELLILDEPTTGLDPLVQQEFYRLLDEIRDAGRTVFLSSHVLPEVERVCDRVAIIREGEVIAVEDVAAIKRKAIRRVEVTFDAPVSPDAFSRLPVQELVVQDRVLRCSVQGPIDPLIKALAAFRVVDMISHEPSLEEVFMALYGENDVVG
jgi:ABC-2 type transport system ATP-binding protein